MCEIETTENSNSVFSIVKTTAEVVVLVYVTITAAKGLYGLASGWTEVIKENRRNKKNQK